MKASLFDGDILNDVFKYSALAGERLCGIGAAKPRWRPIGFSFKTHERVIAKLHGADLIAIT